MNKNGKRANMPTNKKKPKGAGVRKNPNQRPWERVVKKTKRTPKRDPRNLLPSISLEKLKKQNFTVNNIDINKDTWQKRVFIFTPTTGTVRMEWVQARYSQIIPVNWSTVDVIQFLNPYVPIGYQLADAQNLMAKHVVEGGYEWVIYLEHDNVLPNDAFLRLNQYINEQNIPVVSALYWLKSDITEPLLFRGRGTSHFKDWKLGDRVWVDGVPFGFRLEHASLIRAAWEESPEYQVGGTVTRRVFGQPSMMFFDEEKGGIVTQGGTTDLAWCSRIMDDHLFEKAGWSEFQKLKYPFLVDTNLFVKHIDEHGRMFPVTIPQRFVPEKGYKPRNIKD